MTSNTNDQNANPATGRYWAGRGLTRDVRRGVLFGVCAGLARFLRVDLKVTRILMVIGAVFFTWPVLIAYAVAALMLERGDSQPAGRSQLVTDHASASSATTGEPTAPPAAEDVAGEFDHIETKLRSLEAYLASREFELDREFKRLDQQAAG